VVASGSERWVGTDRVVASGSERWVGIDRELQW
jgi:hypothetical protein